ncbi:hypothetical protein Tco_0455929 [Tanacetum coccineum]
MCKAYGGEPSVDLLQAFLNLGPAGNWLTLSNRSSSFLEPRSCWSFIMEGIDDEFYFEPEGGVSDGEGISPSIKTVNNEALVINVEPLNSAPPSQLVENIRDSDNAPSKKDVVDEARNQKLGKSLKATGNDPDIHELKDSIDCHWVVAHTVLDSMLNNRTRKLISTLMKARASCDAIRERESEKDKAYAELKRKCNDALHDLDKNPLVLDMRAEIKTLQGDRIAIVAKVVSHVAIELVRTFEEVATLKEPFELEKMYGYRPLSKKEFDQAGDNLATASYPFLAEATADLYSPLEKLLSVARFGRHPVYP